MTILQSDCLILSANKDENCGSLSNSWLRQTKKRRSHEHLLLGVQESKQLHIWYFKASFMSHGNVSFRKAGMYGYFIKETQIGTTNHSQGSQENVTSEWINIPKIGLVNSSKALFWLVCHRTVYFLALEPLWLQEDPIWKTIMWKCWHMFTITWSITSKRRIQWSFHSVQHHLLTKIFWNFFWKNKQTNGNGHYWTVSFCSLPCTSLTGKPCYSIEIFM